MPNPVRDYVRRLFAPFLRPPRPQVAALCWRSGKAGVEVLMITTRTTGRWTPPRGGLMAGKTAAEAAAQEAWEEAGVRGAVSDEAIGVYRYDKLESRGGVGEPMRVEVFALKVAETRDAYPEAKERRRRWMSREDAAKAVREPELKALIRGFDPQI